ncbi:MAG: hypothetical protein GF364_09130 [Candidatus Lokiarchaeota archaeon]|nr:hypothetical protein [Candidatus Lokiarchaeota archaeon]
MVNLFSIISVTIIFIIIMIVFSSEKIDYLVIALLGAIIAALILINTKDSPVNLDLNTFIGMIEWRPLIFILGMQIIISIAEQKKIFHYIAVKSIQVTKGNDRMLFYVIIIISTLSAAVVADVTVSIIFAPLLIRTCKILEIESAPYLFGMTICINIGSLITPFSSSENIMIAGHFNAYPEYNVDVKWFALNIMLFGFILLFVTLITLDYLMLKKNERANRVRVELVREILLPSMVLDNKKAFNKNLILLVVIFTAFFFTTEAYLVALIGAIVMVLANKEKMEHYFRHIEWNVIFFFASLYIIIGVMVENGTIQIINDFLNTILPDNVLVISIIFLVFSSIISGFLANSPTALIFMAIADAMIAANPIIAANPNILIMALLIGINLGGNFLPQGAACDVMTLTIATKNKVKGFTFKTLTKWGALFALIHMIFGIFYLIVYYFLVF